MTEQEKKLCEEIDQLDQYALCKLWRFSPSGHPYFQGSVGEYFQAKLKEKGGFTPEISKSLGW